MPERCIRNLACAVAAHRGPTTNVQYRLGPIVGHGVAMANSTRTRSRRSLRPIDADELIECTIVTTEPTGGSTIEIVGGPPRSLAMVEVDAWGRWPVRLDACGAGLARIGRFPVDATMTISIDGRVVLTGRLSASTNRARS